MKRSLTLSLILFMFITVMSCKKKSAETNLNGSWELRYLEGIQVPNVDPNFKAGNGNILKFSDHNFERYENGKLVQTGTFTFQPEKTTVNNTAVNYSIVFANDEKQYLYLSGNKLILFQGVIAADGTASTYVKQ
ncbi:hypothetical protein [Pedobacter sp. L105]|uniref:hypothetical protein n=1 Tax=Pedobacter sp. L105 TaxID=1641871 RepID=UPI00131B77FD|nr:hypothetical protein [Pedobacter sp. L105]